MKTELRPCPFCGREGLIFEPYSGCTDVGSVECVCGLVYTTISQGLDDWNVRPIEDGLRAEIETRDKRIAELEAERLELRKTLGWAYDLDEYKDNPEERER